MRLAPRIIEMALRDVDLSVRVTALSVITKIDKSGILEDTSTEIRSGIAKLVFDQELKVRQAVGSFVKGLWEERTEKLKLDVESLRGKQKKNASGIPEEEMQDRLEWKAFAEVLVETTQSLDEDVGSSSQGNGNSGSVNRASAAVEALFIEVAKLGDWEGLVDYLLLDHSKPEDNLWLLYPEEEDFMLQVLIACIKNEDKVSTRKVFSMVLSEVASGREGN